MSIVTTCLKDPSNTIPYILMASAIYYYPQCYNYRSPPLEDEEFDSICRIAHQYWGEIEHSHKHLITEDDLSAGTLFDLKWEEYPDRVKMAASLWLSNWEPDADFHMKRIRLAVERLIQVWTHQK